MSDQAAMRPARNLQELLSQFEICRRQPVLTLREALRQLGPLDAPTLAALAGQDPELLRGGHAGLLDRLLLTPDELGRALARVGGLPEVDPLRFDIPAGALRRLPTRVARSHKVLPLGAIEEHFFVACGNPDNEDLRRHLAHQVGEGVVLVWADSGAIERRLDAEDQLAAGKPPPVPLPWVQPPRDAAVHKSGGGDDPAAAPRPPPPDGS